MPSPRSDHPHEHRSVPRPPWLLVLAALVCVGLVAWWAASQRGRSFDPQQLIETQLQAAEKATGEGHYVDPYEGSALHYYSTVLTIERTGVMPLPAATAQ